MFWTAVAVVQKETGEDADESRGISCLGGFQMKKSLGFSEYSKFKPSFPVLIGMHNHLGGTSTCRLLHLT